VEPWNREIREDEEAVRRGEINFGSEPKTHSETPFKADRI